jgi:hypothetical protein
MSQQAVVTELEKSTLIFSSDMYSIYLRAKFVILAIAALYIEGFKARTFRLS